jgi:prevent-host-death family protein
MKKMPLTKAKDDLSALIRDAEKEEVLITRHGRPAAIVIGFANEDEWLEYRLLNDERFLASVERAREDAKKWKVIAFIKEHLKEASQS